MDFAGINYNSMKSQAKLSLKASVFPIDHRVL